MVADGGIGALSLRSLAAAEATSTTAVYSLFGGKPALLAALHERGFDLFSQAQTEALATADREPVDGLRALGRAYWRWALANPHLYLVMFDPALREYISAHQRATSEATLRPLREMIVRTIDSGDIKGDPEAVAFSLWSALHGSVNLLLAGYGPADDKSRDALLEQTLLSGLRAWST